MAIIKDGSNANLYPTTPAGSYIAGAAIRHTATDAADSAVIALRNPSASTKTVCIRRIYGNMLFDGTASAGNSLGYEFIRFSAGDPTTGTTLPRIKKKNSYAASQILDANAQFKSGVLTMTSVVYESEFFFVRAPASVTAQVVPFEIPFVTAGAAYEPFELAVGEGIAVRLNIIAIVGQGLAVTFEWDER